MHGLLLVALLATTSQADQEPRNERSASVGYPARIEELVLPGPELELRPIDDETEIVVRIVALWPHGTDWRYELEWYGVEPGTYELTDYLQRKDGTPAEDLPAVQIEVLSVLPSGQVRPNLLTPERVPGFGGYRVVLGVAIGVWVVGLLALVLARRRGGDEGVREAARPLSLAERLQPLVERARHGEITSEERAELERTLLSYWRRRLGLTGSAAEAMVALRGHAEAGPLIEALERWLHRPGSDIGIDVSVLLAPYQDLPAEPESAHAVS